jgi:hypothetical protein
MERAIETAMKVSSAEGAHIPPAHGLFSRRAFLAGITGFHVCHNSVLSGTRQAQREYHDVGR